MWRALAERLEQAGHKTSRLDARLLLGQVLNLDPVQMAVNEHDEVHAGALAELEELAQRRLAGEPVARIFGTKEFYGLEFALNDATLVPRPETELLVDIGLDFLKNRQNSRLLDLGTGSGCIVISLLANCSDVQAVAVDLSRKALVQAKQNSVRHGVEARLQLVVGSWFEQLGDQRFDLIVSNPPYIARRDIDGLAKDVRIHDPYPALDGGTDGLDAYRSILSGADTHLNIGGKLALEIGHDQAELVQALCQENGFANLTLHRDMAGQDRVIVASR